MRKKMVAGNWKMNMTPSQAVELVNTLKDGCNGAKADVLFCVPAIDITTVVGMTKDTDICVGAENMFYEDKGAYTGEISAEMLKDAGVKYVIIGHSERRQIFNETDEIINKKVVKAFENDLIPVLCCGESLEIREAGTTLEFVEAQIEAAFKNVSDKDAAKTVIAYEPIWAIGTGKVATAEQAQEVCKAIRDKVAKIYTQELADNMQILYGGSVSAASAPELFSMADIDGGLVGGASLKAEFIDIVKAAE